MARILITSAIPYINGIKHLGNLVGSQLPADLYARYMRARGHEVMFLCATDEHGTPAELAAAKAGKPVAAYCAEMWQVQKDLSDGFRLSFDHFGRSSSPQNHRLTQHFAGKLHEAGLIREVTEQQMYSPADGRFLPDRYIEGTCPNCGFESARGDQCDNCTKQLDPVDLIDPRSTISGSTDLEMRETKHLFLCQSQLKDRLAAWIDSKTDWPVLTTSIAKKWLNDGDGLQDRGITRDLDWGIPVKRGDEDWPGMEGKVFYVWFDAPIEYIACAAEWAEAHGKPAADWERWWRTDKGAGDVRYVQFMGKDNVPFHTLSFPGHDHRLGRAMEAGGLHQVVQLPQLRRRPVQHVARPRRVHGPGARYPARRLLALVAAVPRARKRRRGIHLGKLPGLGQQGSRRRAGQFRQPGDQVLPLEIRRGSPRGGDYGEAELALVAELQEKLDAYEAHMEAMEIRKAAAELRAIWVAGNEYLQAAAPWAAYKQDPARAAAIVRLSLNLIRFYAVLSAPFIPDAAAAPCWGDEGRGRGLALRWATRWPRWSRAMRSRCRRCFSPRSATRRARTGRKGSPAPATDRGRPMRA